MAQGRTPLLQLPNILGDRHPRLDRPLSSIGADPNALQRVVRTDPGPRYTTFRVSSRVRAEV